MRKYRILQLLSDLLNGIFLGDEGTPARPMSKNRLLYGGALAHLGQDASPNDLAPDELGCAESVNEIYKKVFGDYFYKGNQLSTYWMYKALKEDSRFVRVATPQAGTIVISPTNAIQTGHVGIFGENNIIMSNNSFKDSNGVIGIWDENYTKDSWTRYFEGRKKLPVYYFDLV